MASLFVSCPVLEVHAAECSPTCAAHFLASDATATFDYLIQLAKETPATAAAASAAGAAGRYTPLCQLFLTAEHVVAAYTPGARNPQWVGYELRHAEQRCNTGGRTDFINDPRFAACGSYDGQTTGISASVWGQKPRGTLDYGGYRAAWDRGHLASSYLTSHDEDTWHSSSYVTNIAPQASPFNRYYWNLLESHLSDYSVARDEDLIIVTGVAYNWTGFDYASGSPSLPPPLVTAVEGTWLPHFFWTAVCERSTGKTLAYLANNVNTEQYKEYPTGLAALASLSELNGILGSAEAGYLLPNASVSVLPAGLCSTGPGAGSALDLGDRFAMVNSAAGKRTPDTCPGAADETPGLNPGDCVGPLEGLLPGSGLVFSKYLHDDGRQRCFEVYNGYESYAHNSSSAPQGQVDIRDFRLETWKNGKGFAVKKDLGELAYDIRGGTSPPVLGFAGRVCFCDDSISDASYFSAEGGGGRACVAVDGAAMVFTGDDQLRLVRKADGFVEDVFGINGDTVSIGELAAWPDGAAASGAVIADAASWHCVMRRPGTGACAEWTATARSCGANFAVDDRVPQCGLRKAYCHAGTNTTSDEHGLGQFTSTTSASNEQRATSTSTSKDEETSSTTALHSAGGSTSEPYFISAATHGALRATLAMALLLPASAAGAV